MNAVIAAWRSARATGSTDQGNLSAILAAQGVTALIAAALAQQLAQVHAEGAAIGREAAEAAVAGANADWSNWKPGDPPQDAMSGLTALEMGTAAAAWAMARTRVDALARQLPDAAQRGETGITQLVNDQLADPDDAHRLALTEIVAASAAAAIAVYRHHGIQKHRWVTEPDGKVCALCLANAAAGPVQVGMPFPSGDVAPPIHPNDRCALLPVPTP